MRPIFFAFVCTNVVKIFVCYVMRLPTASCNFNPQKLHVMKAPRLLFYLDDDSDDLLFFKDAAARLDHEVCTYTNAHEMMLDLHLAESKPDAIFLDVHMPMVNGEEILGVLKHSADWKGIPVVMISGAYPKKLVKHFYDSGADYLMKKRPTMQDLTIAIDEALHAISPAAAR